jgi:plasmid stabilization system protein ParE
LAGIEYMPEAREGLRRIHEHVADRFGERIADQVFDRFAAAFESLAEHPEMGHRRPDITRDDRLRFWSVGPSLVAYRIASDDTLEILFIERGGRDWENVLVREVCPTWPEGYFEEVVGGWKGRAGAVPERADILRS